MTLFSSALATARMKADLTQKELADKADLSITGYKRLEAGITTTPHESTVQALETALGCNLEATIDRTPESISISPLAGKYGDCCPACGDHGSVLESRSIAASYGVIRRRRECQNCGERFTTYELRDDQLSLNGEPTSEQVAALKTLTASILGGYSDGLNSEIDKLLGSE